MAKLLGEAYVTVNLELDERSRRVIGILNAGKPCDCPCEGRCHPVQQVTETEDDEQA